MGEIILNIMYNGDFLSYNTNIGHEVINLFKDDHGKNYIYILPYGNVAAIHNNKVDTILLVKRLGNDMLEIIAKAIQLEQIIKVKTTAINERSDIHNSQIKYIEDNDITYGGVRIDTIMDGNVYHDQPDKDPPYVTFAANDLRKTKSNFRVFLTDCKEKADINKNIYYLECNFAKQSSKMYFSNNDKPIAYKKLIEIINNINFWENENTTGPVDIETDINDKENFLTIIHKEYDELVFSNLLSYYFEKYQTVFQKFAKDILNINISENYSIAREENNIDILVRDSNNIIVIENKIKSGINGVRHDISSENIQSQLGKYYDYANEESNGEKKVSCFIFTPNYNDIDIKKYKNSHEYDKISYKDIYEFFTKDSVKYYLIKDRYYEDFIKALYKHTLEVNNDQYEKMLYKFVQKIRKCKERNHI